MWVPTALGVEFVEVRVLGVPGSGCAATTRVLERVCRFVGESPSAIFCCGGMGKIGLKQSSGVLFWIRIATSHVTSHDLSLTNLSVQCDGIYRVSLQRFPSHNIDS